MVGTCRPTHGAADHHNSRNSILSSVPVNSNLPLSLWMGRIDRGDGVAPDLERLQRRRLGMSGALPNSSGADPAALRWSSASGQVLPCKSDFANPFSVLEIRVLGPKRRAARARCREDDAVSHRDAEGQVVRAPRAPDCRSHGTSSRQSDFQGPFQLSQPFDLRLLHLNRVGYLFDPVVHLNRCGVASHILSVIPISVVGWA